MTAVELEAFLHELAAVSGTAIMPYFRTAMGVDDKGAAGRFDPVTEADRAAEAAMRAMILARFPTHGVIGEEFGAERADADHVWVLDPIDGTRAFIAGLPVWGTLIGLTIAGEPAHGMMHQPFTRERFWGDGRTANWRGPTGEGALATRSCAALAGATIMTTSPKLFAPDDRARYDAVEAACRTYRYGADCYAYCMVAAGQVDLVIEAGLQPYDIVALAPIVAGAGGIVTTWDGGSPAKGGRIVAAGDRRVHDAALRLLNG